MGHWECSLNCDADYAGHLAKVKAAANWAVENQTEHGGWLCWTGLRRPVTSPYSAMAQGEGISLLLRAYSLEQEQIYLQAARLAYQLLAEPNGHGLQRDLGGSIALEEYPGEALQSVLNGWIFALVGLHEMAQLSDDETKAALAHGYAEDLAASLPKFDLGYWSSYDLSGNIASPFYHRLHIDQLRGLSTLFPSLSEDFRRFADTFENQQKNPFNRMRAVSTKIVQKLRQEQVGEML